MKSNFRKITTFLLLITTHQFLKAQPDTLWTKTFGGINNESGQSIRQTSDGGYIIAGTTNSSTTGEDILLIKTDSNGNEMWNTSYGGNDTDRGTSLDIASDGGYIIAGFTWSYPLPYGDGSPNILLIKTDNQGNETWSKYFGGSYSDWGYDVEQTTDNGYIIIGTTENFTSSYDLNLIKTDSTGDEVWNNSFGGDGQDKGYSGTLTQDGGYIVAGPTYSYGEGSYDFWLIKTDFEGMRNGTKLMVALLQIPPIQLRKLKMVDILL